MAYRNVDLPATWPTTTQGWTGFAVRRGLLRAVPPRLEGSCKVCFGAVGLASDGAPYESCYQCNNYYFVPNGGGWPTAALAAFVPISYSLDEGLESLLHQWKNSGEGRANDARARLIGSVLVDFLMEHRRCLEGAAGGFSHLTTVPPRVQRTFSPMITALGSINVRDTHLEELSWDHQLVVRNRADQHVRGQMQPEFYDLGPGRDVTGAKVLLLDDTWTSGASMASVAARLRKAGARSVVGLSVGRQIGPRAYGTNMDLRERVLERTWTPTTCVLCG